MRLDPALPAYLLLEQSPEYVAQLTSKWAETVAKIVDLLYEQIFEDSRLARKLTLLELPNLLALLDWLSQGLEENRLTAEQVGAYAGRIEQLLPLVNRSQALARAVALRERAASALPAQSKVWFENQRLLIERLLDQGELQSAYENAQVLLTQTRAVGPTAYLGVNHDLALAYGTLGRVLLLLSQAPQALELWGKAQQIFEEEEHVNATHMATGALIEQANCLEELGRLTEAISKYEEAIDKAKKLENFRQVAVGKLELATTQLKQGRFDAAISSYEVALSIFEQQDELISVAIVWHRIGTANYQVGQYDTAETAYRQALAFSTRIGNKEWKAKSLGQLGNLYNYKLNRFEESTVFYRQALDIHLEQGDLRHAGIARVNIADALRKLQRYDEAREVVLQAIECQSSFGHTAAPWYSLKVLYQIETAIGNSAAARAAWQQARDAYLAYRQQGGYAQTPGGKLANQLLGSLQTGEADEAIQFLTQASQSAETPNWLRAAAPKLLTILNGSRDRSLADDLALYYDDAAEVLFLIERLNQGSERAREG